MALSKDIVRGRYNFICLVHPSSMKGYIDVVGPEDARPHPGIPKERALGEGGEEEEAARGLVGAGNLAGAATAERAVAGVPASEGGGDLLTSFGPPEYRVRVGGKVVWSFYGLHSISFNPPDEARKGIFIEHDARLVPNAVAWEPQRSPPLPSDRSLIATVRREKQLTINGGSWDGKGHLSSGIVSSDYPRTVAYSLSFSRSGSFAYSCLVHPRMTGRVIVE